MNINLDLWRTDGHAITRIDGAASVRPDGDWLRYTLTATRETGTADTWEGAANMADARLGDGDFSGSHVDPESSKSVARSPDACVSRDVSEEDANGRKSSKQDDYEQIEENQKLRESAPMTSDEVARVSERPASPGGAEDQSARRPLRGGLVAFSPLGGE